MTREELLIGAPIAMLVAYPVIMRLLAAAVHPFRVRLVALERQLVESGALTAYQKRGIHFYVDSAFDPWMMARFAVRFPKLVFLGCIGRGPGRHQWPEGDEGRLVEQFMDMSILSASAANPLFAIVVLLEACALGPIEAAIVHLRQTRTADGREHGSKIRRLNTAHWRSNAEKPGKILHVREVLEAFWGTFANTLSESYAP